MTDTSRSDVTGLLRRWSEGDAAALDTPNLGPARGSGVVVWTPGVAGTGATWKIAHDDLSVPIPNDVMNEFRKRIEDDLKKPVS